MQRVASAILYSLLSDRQPTARWDQKPLGLTGGARILRPCFRWGSPPSRDDYPGTEVEMMSPRLAMTGASTSTLAP